MMRRRNGHMPASEVRRNHKLDIYSWAIVARMEGRRGRGTHAHAFSSSATSVERPCCGDRSVAPPQMRGPGRSSAIAIAVRDPNRALVYRRPTMACLWRSIRPVETRATYWRPRSRTRFRSTGIFRTKDLRSNHTLVHAARHSRIPGIYSSNSPFLAVEVVEIGGFAMDLRIGR